MAEVRVPYIEPGLAAFEALDEYTQGFLLSGDHPRLASYPMKAATDQVFRQFEVVAYNEDDEIVPHTAGEQAIGVITQALNTTGREGVTVPTFYSGCFNPDALVWDEAVSEEDRLTAFAGAPTPTQITCRKRG